MFLEYETQSSRGQGQVAGTVQVRKGLFESSAVSFCFIRLGGEDSLKSFRWGRGGLSFVLSVDH